MPDRRDHVGHTVTGAEVRLDEVTGANWEAVVDLAVDDSQKDLVASNVYSLAEAKFTPLARPRAIYAGDELVGFLMYEPLDLEGKPDQAILYRFMIDKRHQRRGYGHAALECAIKEIAALPRIRTMSVCYEAKNPAKGLYASHGFVEVGQDEDGEIIAELRLPAAEV